MVTMHMHTVLMGNGCMNMGLAMPDEMLEKAPRILKYILLNWFKKESSRVL